MDRLLEAVHGLAHATLNPHDLGDVLDRLTQHVTAVVGADGTGVMLADSEGSLGLAAASCRRTVELERYQDQAGSGPRHEAFLVDRTVVVDDLTEIGRWAHYRERALQLGFRSVVAVPLHAHGETIGVLDAYHGRPHRWSQEDIGACEILAAMAAGYLSHARQMQASHRFAGQLQEALESRAIVERAKGLLMARVAVDADTAFQQLRQESMDTNRKVREIAHDLVTEHTRRVSTPASPGDEQVRPPPIPPLDPDEVVALDEDAAVGR
jgi:GAF domain-containing protein